MLLRAAEPGGGIVNHRGARLRPVDDRRREQPADHHQRADKPKFPRAIHTGIVLDTMARMRAGTRLGPYEILSPLGAGGMGEVYRARDQRLGREVAIKIILSGYLDDPHRVRRFEQEARAAAALNHPNLLAIYDIGTHDGQPYIVTELLEGDPLDRRLFAGPVPIDEVLEFGRQIAEALDVAHARGIVHRDLKPANLFITTRGQVKILDFGLAKMRRDHTQSDAVTGSNDGAGRGPQTRPGTAIGTAAYMSPEQARGEDADSRSDLFSFGLVLYEMATGLRAVRGATDAVVYDAILNRQPKPLLLVDPSLPRGLEQIIERCLQKRPEARYRSASALLADLRSLKTRSGTDQLSTTTRSVMTTMPSIAVLAFVDMSPLKDQDYFCEGMAEELINALTQLPGLQVSSRTSAFQFKGKAVDVSEIGAKLRVETVLEGSVRKAGNRLRISVRLVDASDGRDRWAERYDREIDDVFAVQDEIARTIAEKLKVHLGADAGTPIVKRGTDDLDAYNFYLQGRYHWMSRRGEFFKRAVECFERAIERDSSYAAAYAGLADAYNTVGVTGLLPPHVAVAKAKPAAERAVLLDGSLAEAHGALGTIRMYFDWDFAGAEEEFRTAIAINPSAGFTHALFGQLLGYQGREAEAVAEAVRANQLDPASAVTSYSTVGIYWHLRRYEEGLIECRRALELDPTLLMALGLEMVLLSFLDRHEEAVAAADRATALLERHRRILSFAAIVYARAGLRERALAGIQELRTRTTTEYVSPLTLGHVFVALGEIDEAFEWLERSYDERTPLLVSTAISPLCDPIRDDSRYETLLKKIGVPRLPSAASTHL